MKEKFILKYLLVFFLSLLLSFIGLSFYYYYYYENSFTIDYKPSFIYTTLNKYNLFNNNCIYISNHVSNLLEFSQISKNSKENLLTLLNKCPKEFSDDLKFFNSISDIESNYFYKDENTFTFFIIKYYYYLDKTYILKEIRNHNFKSNPIKLIQEKINNNEK